MFQVAVLARTIRTGSWSQAPHSDLPHGHYVVQVELEYGYITLPRSHCCLVSAEIGTWMSVIFDALHDVTLMKCNM